LGGGFGTLMAPFLLLLGYDPKVIVPAILFSETCSGFIGGGFHTYFKNVNWRSAIITLIGSMSAMIIATFLVGVFLPKMIVSIYISLIAVLLGTFVVIRSFRNFNFKTKTNAFGTCILGFICGFNKGMSGGGYGPLSVSGYMALGLIPAVAIGTTTIVEGIACAAGFVVNLAFIGIVWSMALPMAMGSAIADPISAWVNNKAKIRLKPPFHGRIIGIVMFTLGLVAILKTLVL
jgi:uncharacterized membrane protein YfcA